MLNIMHVRTFVEECSRLELFKPSAIERGDKTFLPIPLFNYNIMLSTISKKIFSSLSPSTLRHAKAIATNKT
jgi:hypothetical protein